MPKNPSELARIEADEEYGRYIRCKAILRGFHTKSSKDAAIRYMRSYERKNGLDGEEYNHKNS